MNMDTKKNLSIDDLIRDLILEDQFKAKYTKRQRSIFCKNMYTKISKFLKEQHRKPEDTEHALLRYRIAYDELNRRYYNQTIRMGILESAVYIYVILTFYYNVYLYLKSLMQLSPQETLRIVG